MGKLLTYSEIDTTIQNRMSGQAPSSTKRLEAINDSLQELQGKYDIEQTKRSADISVIATGSTSYQISDLVTDDDVKRIDELRYEEDDAAGEPYFKYITYEEFMQHVADDVANNEYTLYFEDGVQYLRVNSTGRDTTAITLTMVYYSYFVSMTTASVFQVKVTTTSTDQLLIPVRYKELIIARCLEDLWPMSIGSAGEVDSAKAHNKYKSELKKLGLDDTGRKPKTKQRSIRIYPQY